jgi:hypothetical protein
MVQTELMPVAYELTDNFFFKREKELSNRKEGIR